jgi:hypothetical protein
MKRRHFLGAAGSGVAMSLWPSFLREAFGDSCEVDGQHHAPARQAAMVAAAFRRAEQAGKPLLVLVIPADDGAKYERGETFGELLNFGADQDLAPLARVEVVCATMEDLRKIVPTAGDGEPLMVLVQTNVFPVTAQKLTAVLPEQKGFRRFDANETWEERQRAEDVISDRRIAVLGGLLRGALGADGRAAERLAEVARKNVTQKPPAGAHWARSSGCGTQVEGVTDNLIMGCGMGHVPRKASRFLYFFSLPSRRL